MSDSELIFEQQQGENSKASSAFLDELHEFMEEEDIKELNIDIDSEHFQITTREQANFFLKRISEVREQKKQITEECEKEIQKVVKKVNAFKEKELNSLQSLEDYCVNLLKPFAEQEVAKGNSKSIKLPFGTLAFKKQADKFEYDEDTLLITLRNDSELDSKFVKYDPSPKKAELKKYGTVQDGKLYIDGKLIEGVTIVPQETKFEVK